MIFKFNFKAWGFFFLLCNVAAVFKIRDATHWRILTLWYALLQRPHGCSGSVILHWVYRMSAALGCRACIWEDATGQTLPRRVPSLSTALVTTAICCDCQSGHRSWPGCPLAAPRCPRLPSHVSARRVARPTAQHPCCPLPCHSYWQEPACCHLVYLLCSHTCFSAELGFSYKTRFKDKVLGISRQESRALNPELSPFWEWCAVWLHRSHAHEFSLAWNTDSDPYPFPLYPIVCLSPLLLVS